MLIIGEKINGFIAKTKAAIAERDAHYLKELAQRQQECRADYIDVCAGTTPDAEMETMEWLIGLVQEACSLPISIDSSDPQVLIDCIPFCNKPGILNSVSLEEGKIDKVFPVIANTDWKVVALTCDSNGIPTNAETKVAIARETIALAREYGISDDRLYIDPLVTTLGTDSDSMVVFIDALKQIKAEFPQVQTTSGLSNVSFGLPYRRGLNMQFLCLCLNAGIDSAILDPLDPNIQAVIYATEALLGKDEYCMEYLDAYREGLLPVKPE